MALWNWIFPGEMNQNLLSVSFVISFNQILWGLLYTIFLSNNNRSKSNFHENCNGTFIENSKISLDKIQNRSSFSSKKNLQKWAKHHRFKRYRLCLITFHLNTIKDNINIYNHTARNWIDIWNRLIYLWIKGASVFFPTLLSNIWFSISLSALSFLKTL